MKNSPTRRALADLKKLGFTCQIVEVSSACFIQTLMTALAEGF